MTIQEAVAELIRLEGRDIFKDQKRFFEFLDDLAAEYPKERRIIKNNLDDNILGLFIDDNKKVSHRVRLIKMQLEDLEISRNGIDFILESFGIPLGWEQEILDLKDDSSMQFANYNYQPQKQNSVEPYIKDISLTEDVLKQFGFIDKNSLPSIFNIPSTYKSPFGTMYRIIKIANEVFKDCDKLKFITIPDTVTEIENSAFENCISLEKINIPDSITKIGDRAFANCKLLNDISILNSVTDIGNSAFSGCSSLITAVISNKVIKIPEGLFDQCKSLVNVTIPNGVTDIGDLAFAGCESLSNIIIPKTVTRIGSRAFANCKSLDSIIIPNEVTNIEAEAFGGCNKIRQFTLPTKYTIFKEDVNKQIDLTTKVKVQQEIEQTQRETDYIEVTLDETVLKELGYEVKYEKGEYIFDSLVYFRKNGQDVTEFDIPATYTYNGKNYKITKIGEGTFGDCSSLINVIIPNSVKQIGAYAFSACSSLTSVTIPNSVIKIGYAAFYYCSLLTSVNIPNGLKEIDVNVFCECVSLTNLIIPNSVTLIDEYAFSHCESLKSVTIPSSVTEIKYGAFSYCISLTDVIVPNSVTLISGDAFGEVSHIEYYGTATGAPWGANKMN